MKKLSCKWPLIMTHIPLVSLAFYVFFRVGRPGFSWDKFAQKVVVNVGVMLIIWFVYGLCCLFAKAENLSKANRLTEIEALRAYARMINNLNITHIKPYIADDFHYVSQSVFDKIESKDKFLDYIQGKLHTIRKNRPNNKVWAEIGELKTHQRGRSCVLIAQGKKDELKETVLAKVVGDKIERIDVCLVPSPELAKRTGEYPT